MSDKDLHALPRTDGALVSHAEAYKNRLSCVSLDASVRYFGRLISCGERPSDLEMRCSARDLKRSTFSRPVARLTYPAPQPDGSRLCVCLSAMLEAAVRAPLAKFYALFNDEQRARFNAVPSGEDQNEPERRRNLSVCSERASGDC